VTFKVISRSNIDILLKIQHFERRNQCADLLTLQLTAKVTGVNAGLPEVPEKKLWLAIFKNRQQILACSDSESSLARSDFSND